MSEEEKEQKEEDPHICRRHFFELRSWETCPDCGWSGEVEHKPNKED